MTSPRGVTVRTQPPGGASSGLTAHASRKRIYRLCKECFGSERRTRRLVFSSSFVLAAMTGIVASDISAFHLCEESKPSRRGISRSVTTSRYGRARNRPSTSRPSEASSTSSPILSRLSHDHPPHTDRIINNQNGESGALC